MGLNGTRPHRSRAHAVSLSSPVFPKGFSFNRRDIDQIIFKIKQSGKFYSQTGDRSEPRGWLPYNRDRDDSGFLRPQKETITQPVSVGWFFFLKYPRTRYTTLYSRPFFSRNPWPEITINSSFLGHPCHFCEGVPLSPPQPHPPPPWSEKS